MNGDLRVLLVDDNEGCRELYRRNRASASGFDPEVLHALWLDGNYDVQTAENGLAAIETVTDDIDLVLLDRNMPGPNGVDVSRAAVERLLEESVIDWKTAFTVLEETEPPETPEQATETQTLLVNS